MTISTAANTTAERIIKGATLRGLPAPLCGPSESNRGALIEWSDGMGVRSSALVSPDGLTIDLHYSNEDTGERKEDLRVISTTGAAERLAQWAA